MHFRTFSPGAPAAGWRLAVVLAIVAPAVGRPAGLLGQPIALAIPDGWPAIQADLAVAADSLDGVGASVRLRSGASSLAAGVRDAGFFDTLGQPGWPGDRQPRVGLALDSPWLVAGDLRPAALAAFLNRPTAAGRLFAARNLRPLRAVEPGSGFNQGLALGQDGGLMALWPAVGDWQPLAGAWYAAVGPAPALAPALAATYGKLEFGLQALGLYGPVAGRAGAGWYEPGLAAGRRLWSGLALSSAWSGAGLDGAVVIVMAGGLGFPGPDRPAARAEAVLGLGRLRLEFLAAWAPGWLGLDGSEPTPLRLSADGRWSAGALSLHGGYRLVAAEALWPAFEAGLRPSGPAALGGWRQEGLGKLGWRWEGWEAGLSATVQSGASGSGLADTAPVSTEPAFDSGAVAAVAAVASGSGDPNLPGADWVSGPASAATAGTTLTVEASLRPGFWPWLSLQSAWQAKDGRTTRIDLVATARAGGSDSLRWTVSGGLRLPGAPPSGDGAFWRMGLEVTVPLAGGGLVLAWRSIGWQAMARSGSDDPALAQPTFSLSAALTWAVALKPGRTAPPNRAGQPSAP